MGSTEANLDAWLSEIKTEGEFNSVIKKRKDKEIVTAYNRQKIESLMSDEYYADTVKKYTKEIVDAEYEQQMGINLDENTLKDFTAQNRKIQSLALDFVNNSRYELTTNFDRGDETLKKMAILQSIYEGISYLPETDALQPRLRF